jgi:hypothetical protein
MNVTTVGIDLAKNVFQVHGVDARGKVVLRRQLRREQVAAFFVNLPPCLIGMESCASAHHWGPGAAVTERHEIVEQLPPVAPLLTPARRLPLEPGGEHRAVRVELEYC